MKKIIYSTILLLVLTSVSCQSKSNYVKVDKSEFDKKRVEFAKNLSEKILTAQKNDGYYSLSENEATIQMIDGLDESRQKESYKKIKSIFGDYKSLKFESIMESTTGNKLMIYRFKGFFESNADIEVRTVLNYKGKLAGFFIKPWNDEM